MSGEIRRGRGSIRTLGPPQGRNTFPATPFGLLGISPSARETDSSDPFPAADVIRHAEFDAPSERYWLVSGTFVKGSPPAPWSSGAWALSYTLRGSAFRHGAKDAGVTPELLSFGVGLFCRMGIGKSRDGHAGVVDAHDLRIWVEREVEGLGRRHLGDKANIRDARPVAMTEVPT